MKPGDSEMARLLVGQGGQTAVGAADGEGDDPDGEDDSADDQKDGDGDAPTRPGRRGQARLSQPGQPARGAKATPPAATPLAANGQRFFADQELVESLTAAALAQAASPLPATAVRSAILAAEGPEDLATRLAALYQG